MKRHESMQPAPYGLYVATSGMDVRFVGADGDLLEGLPGVTYRRVPTLLALLLAPVLGGAFVMAFPLVVLTVSVGGLLTVAARGARKAAADGALFAGPRWEPATSYLSKGEKKGDPDEVPPELNDLKSEVDARRADEDSPRS
ncbi:MAG: hypothetical protein AMXMBFR64_41570 [Myxococcales bacterium]